MAQQTEQPENKKGFSGKQVAAIVIGVMLATVLVTIFSIRIWLFPRPFTPIVLNHKEEQRLAHKLEQIQSLSVARSTPVEQSGNRDTSVREDFNGQGELQPVPYSEKGASRDIRLSEREINSLLANNTDLARKMAIDLADDLISLRLLLPVDQDFPIMGGKTIRARAGAELAYREGRPVVILKGVSLMGVPMPNGWLGGLKNIDLVQEFGGDQGFWKSFSEGVETIRVREGELSIRLKE